MIQSVTKCQHLCCCRIMPCYMVFDSFKEVIDITVYYIYLYISIMRIYLERIGRDGAYNH